MLNNIHNIPNPKASPSIKSGNKLNLTAKL